MIYHDILSNSLRFMTRTRTSRCRWVFGALREHRRRGCSKPFAARLTPSRYSRDELCERNGTYHFKLKTTHTPKFNQSTKDQSIFYYMLVCFCSGLQNESKTIALDLPTPKNRYHLSNLGVSQLKWGMPPSP